MKNRTPKYLVKKLASKYISPEIIYREKVGFDLPLQNWISNDLKELMAATITDSVQKEFINIGVINQCFDLHVNQNIDHSTKLWAFLCLELSYKYLSGIS